jgi:hypothetical protein
MNCSTTSSVAQFSRDVVGVVQPTARLQDAAPGGQREAEAGEGLQRLRACVGQPGEVEEVRAVADQRGQVPGRHGMAGEILDRPLLEPGVHVPQDAQRLLTAPSSTLREARRNSTAKCAPGRVLGAK